MNSSESRCLRAPPPAIDRATAGRIFFRLPSPHHATIPESSMQRPQHSRLAVEHLLDRLVLLTAKMRFLTSLLVTLLPFTVLGARRGAPSGNVFETYHSKSLSTPSLKLDDSIFNELTAVPRNHSTLVCLTALDARFGCAMCHQFKPEWELLAKSWIGGDKSGKTRLLFGQLDFLEGKQTFESV